MTRAKESAVCVPERQLKTGNGDGRRGFFRKIGAAAVKLETKRQTETEMRV